ncbi:HD-GYP domain-containing protein (c-di-GMP phosphodiesterase class II) [Desulfitispora alkaliphila]|uniref:HD-GYP domain-containing protein n=1 Tax=Desulfitispora alkaliphila TaxID=622674 RepID=UPI003D1C6710
MRNKGKLVGELITAISLALDLEEDVKLYHAWRVGVLGQAMAELVKPELKVPIFYAGLLHDVGAIGLDDHVVHYPTKEEQLVIPQIVGHCHKGASIVGALPGLEEAKEMILDHHEWYDGSGYPVGKKGDEICLGGQILRLADSFDLWVRYNPNATKTEILAKAQKGIGTEYSREIYDLFAETIARGTFFHKLTRENSLVFHVSQIREQMELEIEASSFTLDNTLKVFARVIDTKHSYTKGHSERVASYASDLAKTMGFNEETVILARHAGLLHDVGKLAVPRKTLDKPGRLEPQELQIIKIHPLFTMEILEYVGELAHFAPISGAHHERVDGLGYPDGLKGYEIPLLGRIMAVADAFDAMTTNRPYQRTRSFSDGLEILKENAGTQFDSQVVEAAIATFD